MVTLVLLAGIFVFLLASSFGFFRTISLKEFLLTTDWNPSSYRTPTWGILSSLAGTAMITALSLVIAIPFGICIAIYLSEIAHERTRELIKPTVELIASIPSVVLGLLGLLYVAPLIARIFNLSNGLNAVTASILVAITATPTIASIAEDALSNVSDKIREASIALGADRLTTIRRIVVPAAVSGLTASVMLGLGRVIGETMIVLMVAGNTRAFPHSFFDPVQPLTATIAIEIKEVVVGSLHWQGLFAIGVLLFLFTFFLNILADLLLHRRGSEVV